MTSYWTRFRAAVARWTASTQLGPVNNYVAR